MSETINNIKVKKKYVGNSFYQHIRFKTWLFRQKFPLLFEDLFNISFRRSVSIKSINRNEVINTYNNKIETDFLS
jgi:hypothetical protein